MLPSSCQAPTVRVQPVHSISKAVREKSIIPSYQSTDSRSDRNETNLSLNFNVWASRNAFAWFCSYSRKLFMLLQEYCMLYVFPPESSSPTRRKIRLEVNLPVFITSG